MYPRSKFVSEFGFQSYPSFGVLKNVTVARGLELHLIHDELQVLFLLACAGLQGSMVHPYTRLGALQTRRADSVSLQMSL